MVRLSDDEYLVIALLEARDELALGFGAVRFAGHGVLHDGLGNGVGPSLTGCQCIFWPVVTKGTRMPWWTLLGRFRSAVRDRGATPRVRGTQALLAPV